MNNVWDNLSGRFDTYKEKVSAEAADNIEIAWPVILRFIRTNLPQPQGMSALDFGCGTGMFCHTLKSMGFKVAGIDPSRSMIEIARGHSDRTVQFIVGDAEVIPAAAADHRGGFDIVTSVMVLQFVNDIKKSLRIMSENLKTAGYIIFAVHNPEYLRNSGVTDKMDFGDVNVPIYNRNEQDYTAMLSELGFKKIFEEYPTFTKEFITAYKPEYNTDIPEYMVLGYKKQ